MNEGYFWPDGKQLALSIVVNIEEGAEARIDDGDRAPEPVDELGIHVNKPIRNYGNESNYQYGIKAGAPRVMALLDRYAIPATFTAAAVALERAPELAQRIASGAHEVAAHGARWVHQFRMTEAEERAFIRQAVQSITTTVGRRPDGWLSRYLLTDNTRRLLVEEGFSYHMDDYSDDRPFWADVPETEKAIAVVPYALDSNDMKFWTDPALTPPQWLDYAIDTFDQLYEEGTEQCRMMSLGVHLRIIGRPGRIRAFDRFLSYATRKPNVWVATRRDIRNHFAQKVPPPAPAAGDMTGQS